MNSKKTPCPALFGGWAFVIFLACSVCLAGCTEESVSTPIPTALDTPQSTLPPTWTPTHTWTPLPATLTPTVTHTPTITPTLDPAQVCEDFDLFSAPTDGFQVDYDGLIAFSWQNAPPNAEIHIAILNSETDEGILVRWPAHQSLNMPVEMSYLPSPGRYDWQLSIYDGQLGDLCSIEGWFERKAADEKSPTPTSEAPLDTATPPNP